MIVRTYILIGSLGPIVYYWTKVVQQWKGRSFDLSDYVTRKELASVKAERDTQLSETLGFIKQRLDSMDKLVTQINSDMPNLHRALGRVEGHDEAAKHGRR